MDGNPNGKQPEEKKDGRRERTEVVCIIDRSGSMEAIRSDAIGGFNAFLAEQQALPGDCRLTLVLFDHTAETVHFGADIHQVEPLDESSYVPRGSTALLDAIRTTLETTRSRIRMELTAMVRKGEETPLVKVVVVILTDGEENASRYATRDEVFRMINDSRRNGWEFLFLAANQDAIRGGASIGIDQGHSIGFRADQASTHDAFNSISGFVTNSRLVSSGGGSSGGGRGGGGRNYH